MATLGKSIQIELRKPCWNVPNPKNQLPVDGQPAPAPAGATKSAPAAQTYVSPSGKEVFQPRRHVEPHVATGRRRRRLFTAEAYLNDLPNQVSALKAAICIAHRRIPPARRIV
jgi:hypothetical protein